MNTNDRIHENLSKWLTVHLKLVRWELDHPGRKNYRLRKQERKLRADFAQLAMRR